MGRSSQTRPGKSRSSLTRPLPDTFVHWLNSLMQILHGGFFMPSDQLISELLSGDCLSTGQVARSFPPKRGRGKSVNPSTVYRWATSGAKTRTGRNVRLETALVGGRMMTSKAALERFIRMLNDLEEGPEQPLPRSESARLKAAERASKQLEAMGC